MICKCCGEDTNSKIHTCDKDKCHLVQNYKAEITKLEAKLFAKAEYDYHFVIDCEPKAQGRPRTRIVQAKVDVQGFIDNVLTMIGNMRHPNELRDWGPIRRQAAEVSIAASKKAFATIYDDPKSAKAKLEFAIAARQFAPEKLIDQAIRVDTTFYMPRPKSHYGTGRNSDKLKGSAPTFHIKKPDRDNLDKLVLDALTGVVWTDDSIICKGLIEKVYARKPRVEVKIKLLEEMSVTLF